MKKNLGFKGFKGLINTAIYAQPWNGYEYIYLYTSILLFICNETTCFGRMYNKLIVVDN